MLTTTVRDTTFTYHPPSPPHPEQQQQPHYKLSIKTMPGKATCAGVVVVATLFATGLVGTRATGYDV